MKIRSLPLVLLAMTSAAMGNTAPTVVIQSAAMRPGTTLMDVVYRVNDPDDATVRTRALAFVDGTRSFAKALKPVTFVEGTAAKLGDAIPANVDHTLTWNVAADWNVDLGQLKFEVLAMDQRGLLPFDWITIPAAGGKPALSISKDAPTDAQVLNALFWCYADGDSGLTLANGLLRGTTASGVFSNLDLANGKLVYPYAPPFIFKRMKLAVADATEMHHASVIGRVGLLNPANWHAVNQPYDGASVVVGWPLNAVPTGLGAGVTAIAVGETHTTALKSDGTVVQWNLAGDPTLYNTFPVGLNGVTAITAGWHSLALKSDGTVIGAGGSAAATVPAGLSGVTAIAAGLAHSLALKSNGTVIGWGSNNAGKINIPAELAGVIAIAAGRDHSIALKNDGTVVQWGSSSYVPAGLSGVTAIAASGYHSLALKSDGTVVQWGYDPGADVPAGLTGVTAIAAGDAHNLALKSDGTVVAWGRNESGQTIVPADLSGVTLIAAGYNRNYVIKVDAP